MKKHDHHILCAAHLEPMLTPKRAKYTAKQVIKMIRSRNLEFDAIACRGFSGLLIAPIVAMRLNKALIVVRKDEKTHSSHKVEGDHGAKHYLILDDFIDGGGTVRAITEGIFKINKDARCVGFIAYKRLSFEKSTDSFEQQMINAWWDDNSNFLERYFPEKYYTAVKEEQCEKMSLR